jgi:phosphate transport system protein
MTVHLHRDLGRLQQHIIRLSERVEETVRKSVTALRSGRYDLALDVIQGDVEVDRMEVEIEEECLKVLALHQPVAVDLRFVAACLKIDNDLERMGDLAVNIAERAIDLSNLPPVAVPAGLEPMTEAVTGMIRKALHAFVRQDPDEAREVLAADDAVDELNRKIFRELRRAMHEDPDLIDACLPLWSVSRHLERIADHATNVAEDVYYLVKGEIIRHARGKLPVK